MIELNYTYDRLIVYYMYYERWHLIKTDSFKINYLNNIIFKKQKDEI